MTQAEKDRHRIEGFKAALAVLRRHAQREDSLALYDAHDWLEEQGRARWREFTDVPALWGE